MNFVKKILTYLVTFFFVTEIQGWIMYEPIPPEKIKGHENECYSEKVGYFTGVKKIPNECVEVQCVEDLLVEYRGCLAVHVEAPCQLLNGDITKPYPDCCFDVKCP